MPVCLRLCVRENEVVGMFSSSSQWLTTDAGGLFLVQSFSTYLLEVLRQRLLAKAGRLLKKEKKKERKKTFSSFPRKRKCIFGVRNGKEDGITTSLVSHKTLKKTVTCDVSGLSKT